MHKVRVDEGDEDAPRAVKEVHVESVYTQGGYEFNDELLNNLDKIVPPPTTRLFDTRGELEKRQLDDHEATAARSFAGFELVGGHRHVYPELRRWKFRRPDHGNHAFSLVVWPGYLFVGGDLDECVWVRAYDMLEWAKGAVHSLDYFAGKVINPIKTREWCSDQAKAWAWEEYTRRAEELLMEGRKRSDGWKRDEVTLEKLAETRDSLIARAEEGKESFWSHAYYHNDWMDGGDPPNLNRWTYTFLWARSAVKVALRLLGYTAKE